MASRVGGAMDEQLGPKLKEAETAVLEAERTFGAEHVELANALSKYAALLKQANNRALDAVNVEARAKAIRAKIYAAEAASHPTATIAGKKWHALDSAPQPGAYLGLAGVALSLFSLVLPQYCFALTAIVCAAFVAADIYLSKTVPWRTFLTAMVLVASWFAIESVPPRILVDETPIDRWLYASQHPRMVANVRKLGDPQHVLNFGICLPKGLTTISDQQTGGARVIKYKYETPPVDSSVAEFAVIQTPLPDDVLAKIHRYSVTKMTREVALPVVLDVLNLDPTLVGKQKPKIIDINGIDFVHFNFEARSSAHDGERMAFMYSMRDKSHLITICGSDSMQAYGQTLGLLESSLYTLVP